MRFLAESDQNTLKVKPATKGSQGPKYPLAAILPLKFFELLFIIFLEFFNVIACYIYLLLCIATSDIIFIDLLKLLQIFICFFAQCLPSPPPY